MESDGRLGAEMDPDNMIVPYDFTDFELKFWFSDSDHAPNNLSLPLHSYRHPPRVFAYKSPQPSLISFLSEPNVSSCIVSVGP